MKKYETLIPEANPILIPDWQTVVPRLKMLGRDYGAKVFDLRGEINRSKGEIKNWWQEQQRKLAVLGILKDIVENETSRGTALSRAEARYNIEYSKATDLSPLISSGLMDLVSSSLNGNCNYSFWSPLMNKSVFTKIVGRKPRYLGRILNVGAGSGDMEKWLLNQGVKSSLITSTDISKMSVALLGEIGVSAKVGRLEAISSSIEPVDSILLSYFVDRDSDQKSTFKSALNLLNPGGILVMEGLLPAKPVDPSGVVYVDSQSKSVTRGFDPIEDMGLICDFLGSTTQIQRLGVGTRFVYSRDGLEELASYILTAKKLY